MEPAYNAMYDVGDHLVLELFSGDIFQGDYCNGGKNHMDLNNTKQYNNPNKLGLFTFYRNEILKIRSFKKKTVDKPINNVTEINTKDKIKIVEDEYYRLIQMSKDFVYLERADNRYYDAVKKLADSETVGVVSLGIEYRYSNINLLVLCTWKEVFIFDLTHFKQGQFHAEIKDILESKYISKVMHKGGPMIDILYRRYQIYVRNVFDTQVVDLIIDAKINKARPQQAITLSEALTKYFNVPSSLLNSADQVTPKKWQERPLSDKKKLYAAQLAAYLIILKDEMQKCFLKDVYNAIDNVHDLFYHCNDYDFFQMVETNKVTDNIKKAVTFNKT